MPETGPDKEMIGRELKIQRQIAFVSGMFQADVTVHTILESLAEGVVIIDDSGTILLVNTAAEKMFGYPRGDLIGTSHALLLPGRFRKSHEEHIVHYFEEPRCRPMGKVFDIAGLRRDGSEFPVEIGLSFLETINGVLVLALVSDVTFRKRAEKRLRENEELFHIQVEKIKNYAIFTLDKLGNVLNWNSGAERLTGYRADEIIGRPFSCLYSGEDKEAGRPETGLKKAAEKGQLLDEGWLIRKDGSRFWADDIITTLTDEGGHLIGFSKVIHDITKRRKIEDTLRFSESRYRALYLDNPTMIFTLNTDWTILSANPYGAVQLGYTIDELEGQSGLKLFHEDDRPAVIEQFRSCLRDPNQVHRWQFRKVREDGGLLWVEEIAQAVYDLNGALNILVVCQDFTERKRAEEALRESEQRFESFMHYLPAAAWIKELHGRYVYANSEAERIFSQSMSALQGKTDEEIFAPETARQFRDNDARVSTEGGCLRTIEALRHPDGVEHQSIVSKFALPGPNGQPAYIAGVALDITETKKVKESLRKSEEKFAKIFQTVPALICITTLDEGRCLDINERGLQALGFRREEVVGRTLAELGVWESDSARENTYSTVKERGEVRDLEIAFRGKDRKPLTGIYSAELIELDGERYVLSIIKDITDRKQMEEEIARLNIDLAARASELEDANKELESFSYTVAHDLRQPLNIISSCCQVLDKLYADGLQEDPKELIRKTYESSLQMNRMIETLLNFSRFGRVDPHRETIDMSGLAGDTAASLKLTEPERQVEFRIADGIVANGDANLLRIVLDNLLGNAWKYTALKEQAVIEVGVRDIEGVATYFVQDNGSGFDMADADRLFVPFQRLPGAGRNKGFGIGLATVERIVKRHGGKVWAEGKPGEGACIFFTLPEKGR